MQGALNGDAVAPISTDPSQKRATTTSARHHHPAHTHTHTTGGSARRNAGERENRAIVATGGPIATHQAELDAHAAVLELVLMVLGGLAGQGRLVAFVVVQGMKIAATGELLLQMDAATLQLHNLWKQNKRTLTLCQIQPSYKDSNTTLIP